MTPVFRRLGRMRFADALDMQEALAAKVESGEIPETVLLVEHEPVYTIGRTPDKSSLVGGEALPAPVHEISRGGQATWHGPGQLVVYPLLNLNGRGRDLHRHLRDLEELVILGCATFALKAGRREGLTGVWVEDRKIASIGVGVRRWITRHGLAWNIGTDLSGFDPIVPCGISGVRMTSLSRETGVETDVWEAARRLEPLMAAQWTV